MNHRYSFIISIITFVVISSFSCKKEESNSNIFYGKWKASYGDTIIFARENGRDILLYDVSGSPGPPIAGYTAEHEFDYKNGKLLIKEGIGTNNNFRTVGSFEWAQFGSEFKIEKSEWLFFISSVGKFSFTKIQ